MKGFFTTIFLGIAIVVVTQTVNGQSIVYVSNLSEPLYGYNVGNGSQAFQTGTASGGYLLNSITLVMGYRLDNASNFNVSVYSSFNGQIGVSLGSLNGSHNPESAGEYVYTASSLTLSPNTEYCIVATCDSWSPDPIHMPPGGYSWQFTDSVNYASTDGWAINNYRGQFPDFYQFQFAINATPVPEPRFFALVALGAALFLLRGRVCGEA